MTESAFVGRMYLELGDSGSPVAFTRVCEVTGLSGLGETNQLVETTTFCDGGAKTFIGGLAEGSEVTIDANFIVDSQPRRDLIAAVKAKSTLNFRLVVDDDGDGVTDLTFWFRAAAISWNLQPSIQDKNAIQFTVKVSGDIAITEP